MFDNIGDSYIDNKVPYVAFRAMPAMLSALTVPVVYLTMWESGYSLPACLVAAAFVLFGTEKLQWIPGVTDILSRQCPHWTDSIDPS